MPKEKQVSFMLTLPEEYRDFFRVLAAKQNMENPKEVTSAAELAKEILIKHVDNIKKKEGDG